MKHLGEQITDFVFGELSSIEMDEARRHLADCGECRKAVEQFQHTHAMLRTSPDVEPPRRIVFEVEKRPFVLAWRWLAPLAVAAALVIAVLLAAPMQVQWHDSQMTISFGKLPAQPVPAVVQTASVPASVQPVDYDRILKEVQNTQQAWLVSELKRYDAMQRTEIERLRGQLLYTDNMQKMIAQQGNENAASIQRLADAGASKE
jgi:anti-sigma factor RsiW